MPLSKPSGKNRFFIPLSREEEDQVTCSAKKIKNRGNELGNSASQDQWPKLGSKVSKHVKVGLSYTGMLKGKNGGNDSSNDEDDVKGDTKPEDDTLSVDSGGTTSLARTAKQSKKGIKPQVVGSLPGRELSGVVSHGLDQGLKTRQKKRARESSYYCSGPSSTLDRARASCDNTKRQTQQAKRVNRPPQKLGQSGMSTELCFQVQYDVKKRASTSLSFRFKFDGDGTFDLNAIVGKAILVFSVDGQSIIMHLEKIKKGRHGCWYQNFTQLQNHFRHFLSDQGLQDLLVADTCQ
ncbi:hypothetical protein K1719_028176 [Acacia pycnantha]|nr:hypothetical protein K1719_028176 [Acacia pycnantha]